MANSAFQENDPLITAREVSRQLGGINSVTRWRWIKRGILPQPTVISNRNYWRQSQIEALKESAVATAE